jgi:hypothetical protein
MGGRVPVGQERETAACVTCRSSGYRERVDVVEWYDVVGRLCLAALLGGLLGLEREFDGHDACS